MTFAERREMSLPDKDILQFPFPDNDILPVIETSSLEPFVKSRVILQPCFGHIKTIILGDCRGPACDVCRFVPRSILPA